MILYILKRKHITKLQSRQTGQAGLRFKQLLCGRLHWGASLGVFMSSELQIILSIFFITIVLSILLFLLYKRIQLLVLEN